MKKSDFYFRLILLVHQGFIVLALIAVILGGSRVESSWIYWLIAVSALMHLFLNILYPDWLNSSAAIPDAEMQDSGVTGKHVGVQSLLDQIELEYSGSDIDKKKQMRETAEHIFGKFPQTVDSREDKQKEVKPGTEQPRFGSAGSELQKLQKERDKFKSELAVAKQSMDELKVILDKDVETLLNGLLVFCTQNSLDTGAESIENIIRTQQYGELSVKFTNAFLAENKGFKTEIRTNEEKDQYFIMTESCIMVYQLMFRLNKWYKERKKPGVVSNIQVDIEMAQIVKNIFDDIWFLRNDHWNYKLLRGESFSALKETGRRQDASNYNSGFAEYIILCRKYKIELEVFMKQDILCPIWIELDDEQKLFPPNLG
ncbi:MAG: hypothetical protein ACOYNC_01040 [Bacteroidales bacterium]